jgi:hypothetical protein
MGGAEREHCGEVEVGAGGEGIVFCPPESESPFVHQKHLILHDGLRAQLGIEHCGAGKEFPYKIRVQVEQGKNKGEFFVSELPRFLSLQAAIREICMRGQANHVSSMGQVDFNSVQEWVNEAVLSLRKPHTSKTFEAAIDTADYHYKLCGCDDALEEASLRDSHHRSEAVVSNQPQFKLVLQKSLKRSHGHEGGSKAKKSKIPSLATDEGGGGIIGSEYTERAKELVGESGEGGGGSGGGGAGGGGMRKDEMKVCSWALINSCCCELPLHLEWPPLVL